MSLVRCTRCPGVTTVHYPIQEIGQLAAARDADLLAGVRPSLAGAGPQLIVRESTRRVGVLTP